MKISKFLGAFVALLSLASLSQADNIVHVTGSTAFRKAAILGMEAYLASTGSTCVGAYVAPSSGNETAATYVVLQGTVSGVLTTFKCTWTGALGGVIVDTLQDDIRNVPTNGWLSETNIAAAQASSSTPSVPGVYPIVGTPSYTLDAADTSEAPDADFADSAQADTGYVSPVLNGAGTLNVGNPAGPGAVAIVPFAWVFGNSNTTAGVRATPPAVTNITSLQAQALLAGGAYLSTLTGNPSDYNASTGPVVYIVGRNFDSGTRESQFIETGFGLLSSPQQVAVTVTGGSLGAAGTKITQLALYPADTLYPGRPYQLTFSPGQSGYASGGNVAGALNTPGALTASAPSSGAIQTVFQPGIAGGYLIGYLSGYSDAVTATGTAVDSQNSAFFLSFNGVAFNAQNIQQGLYQAWEVEHLYYTPRTTNPITTNQKNALNAVADYIYTNTTTALGGLPLGGQAVSKPNDGGVISHN